MTKDHIFALIMAGGRGTRLWPLTSSRRPKAFLDPDAAGASLLQRTISRLSGLTALENIFVVAGKAHEEELRLQADRIPEQNILLEPVGRSTLPCIGLAGLYIRRRDISSVMAVAPGEQLIKDEVKFQSLMMCAAEVAQSHNSVVILGIKPTFPATRFGYVRLGDEISCVNGVRIFRSRAFTEKPNKQRAQEFLSSGEYLWNSGIFVCSTSLLFEMISKFAPDIYNLLTVIDGAIGSPAERETIERVYPDMRSVSIDYAIMERAVDTLVVPADVGWNDMGTWPEVAEVWAKDSNSNTCFGRHVGIDTSGCAIYSQSKLVATIGIRDIVVIETPDALLLCDRNRADEVRELVQKLEEEGLEER